jgi:hypothetical protein
MSAHLDYIKYIDSIIATASELKDDFENKRFGLCDQHVEDIKDDLKRVETFLLQ